VEVAVSAADELPPLLAKLGTGQRVDSGSNHNGAWKLVEWTDAAGRTQRVMIEAAAGPEMVAQACVAALAVLARGRA
jgi:hypothetical protein